MLAADIIKNFTNRGIVLFLDGDEIGAQPGPALTDDDRHLLNCYKTELLWRLRHPDGDPPVSAYTAQVFINGERVRVPMQRLINEGREIIERDGLAPMTANLDQDLWAASVALRRYSEAHMEGVGV